MIIDSSGRRDSGVLLLLQKRQVLLERMIAGLHCVQRLCRHRPDTGPTHRWGRGGGKDAKSHANATKGTKEIDCGGKSGIRECMQPPDGPSDGIWIVSNDCK